MSKTGEHSGTSPFSWVKKLKKRALKTELISRGLEFSSARPLQEMKNELYNFLRKEAEEERDSVTPDDKELQLPRKDTNNLPSLTTGASEIPENRANLSTTHTGQMCDLVRKWGLKFDGTEGVIAFIERIDELKSSYSFSDNSLLAAVPELLKGKATLWYRNNAKNWHSWVDFVQDLKSNFLPPDYTECLEEEMRRRTQGQEETIRDFAIALRTIMRRHGHMSEVDQVKLLYKNLRPEYKLSIKSRDFQSLEELLNLGTEYELQCKLAKQYRPPPNPGQVHFSDTAYVPKSFSRTGDRKPHGVAASNPVTHRGSPADVSRGEKVLNTSPAGANVTNPSHTGEEMCWNCDTKGHRYSKCEKPRKRFCYRCGTPEVTVKTCENCKSGNWRKV